MKNNNKIRGTLGKPIENNFIGENIARLRNFYRIKQTHLAKILGISRVMLSNYENNKYHVPEEVVEKVSCYFNLTVSELLEDNLPPPKQIN
jgi:transcriptional regulator with XRE-family HTH domain